MAVCRQPANRRRGTGIPAPESLDHRRMGDSGQPTSPDGVALVIIKGPGMRDQRPSDAGRPRTVAIQCRQGHSAPAAPSPEARGISSADILVAGPLCTPSVGDHLRSGKPCLGHREGEEMARPRCRSRFRDRRPRLRERERPPTLLRPAGSRPRGRSGHLRLPVSAVAVADRLAVGATKVADAVSACLGRRRRPARKTGGGGQSREAVSSLGSLLRSLGTPRTMPPPDLFRRCGRNRGRAAAAPARTPPKRMTIASAAGTARMVRTDALGSGPIKSA